MKIQYLGYLIIAAAFYAGFKPLHPLAILVLAFISTFIFATARRQAAKADERALTPSAISDGAYLFVGQLMIIFFVYIFGYFMASSGGDTFIDWITGQGPKDLPGGH